MVKYVLTSQPGHPLTAGAIQSLPGCTLVWFVLRISANFVCVLLPGSWWPGKAQLVVTFPHKCNLDPCHVWNVPHYSQSVLSIAAHTWILSPHNMYCRLHERLPLEVYKFSVWCWEELWKPSRLCSLWGGWRLRVRQLSVPLFRIAEGTASLLTGYYSRLPYAGYVQHRYASRYRCNGVISACQCSVSCVHDADREHESTSDSWLP